MAIVRSDGQLVNSTPVLPYFSPSTAGGISWYSGLVSDYATIYRLQPNVRLVIDFFARNIAQLSIRVFERVSDVERRSLGDSDLGRLMRFPNPATRTTRFRFMRAMVADYKLFDIAFALKVRNSDGKMRLFRLPPQLMQPASSNIWEAEAWRFLGLDDQPIFSADDLLVVRGYNPIDGRVGLSPIESLRQNLAESQAAAEYREQYWRGGARISGVIERPASGQGTPRWSEEAKTRFMAEWESKYTGISTGAGGTPLLEDGMTYKQIAFSAKDSEYLGARRLSREEVAAQYHLSPVFVGILENANFSNVKEQHRHLYQDGFGPDLEMFAQDFQLQLVPEFTDLEFDTTYMEFDLADKLKGSFEERAAQIQTAVGRPWMSANEARAEDNKPPIEGGDGLVTPLNVLIGGQASPTDSAPDPGLNAAIALAQLLELTKSIQLPKADAGRPLAIPAGSKALTKEADDLPEDVVDWFDQHVEMLSSTFDRQKNAVVAALGGGASIESVWDDARWDGELKADFLEIAQSMTGEIGAAAAEAFGGEFDAELADEYLEENARIGAENVNFATKTQLAELEEGDDFLDKVRNVFEVAASSRAAQIAISRVTSVGNFARKEGAQQGGATKKRWNVRSVNSRHPGMDGETVDIDAEFSNGARWPGDSSLDEDQRAGCVCSLEFE